MARYNIRSSGSSEKDINILLLGATGVGKTTFVNAFINSLFYNTLDDAMNGDLKVLVPASFTLTDNDSFESRTIVVGTPDTNENVTGDGASSTQMCRSYSFCIGNRLIRLIDGPGVGDTRSVDHEARNFEFILNYINQYEHLNGICILLKPAQTRLDVYFRYCVKELLRHLHVNAKDNIMFVFTNSRPTFFKPGDTTPLLKKLLKDLHEKNGVDVPFNTTNTFMFDNESFRFLAVYKQGLNFLLNEKEQFSGSWEKSVKEFYRLIVRICQCDLHAIQDTQSLNEAQIIIHKLSRPVGEIMTLIEENIQMAKQYKEKLLKNPSNDLSNSLPQKVGVFVPLRERLTVCVNDKCTEVINVNGEQRINYKSSCHIGCSLHQAVQECIGHPILRRCWAMQRTDNCRKCGCHWMKHMHITYRYEHKVTHVELNESTGYQTPRSILSLIDQRITDLRSEEAEIRRTCVQLSLFLKQNSITPFNDDMLEYLNHFIKEEKQKQSEGKDNAEVIRGLEQMVKDYTQEMTLYARSIPTRSENFLENAKSIEQILELVYKLYALPINGQLIYEQMERMKAGRAQAIAKAEQHVDLPRGFHTPQILDDLKEFIDRKKN